MPLVERDLADWEDRNRDLDGLAEFFNNYNVPFFGFGNSSKNKQLYLKQMAEVHEYVSACLEDLIYDKKQLKKYKNQKDSESLKKKLIKEILNDLIVKDLVSEKKINKVRDNLLHIINEPSFKSLRRAEMMAYGGFSEIRETIYLLNIDRPDEIKDF